MHRREFLEVTLGSLAAALAGCKSEAERRGVVSRAKPMDAAAFHAARRFAETSFGRIAYVEAGSGDAALFLYGFPLNGFQWRGALERNPLAGIEPALKRCTVPTRIVWGTADTIFSPASPDYLERTFPNSRGVRCVAEAKLFFPEELPDLIAEEARRLWSVG